MEQSQKRMEQSIGHKIEILLQPTNIPLRLPRAMYPTHPKGLIRIGRDLDGGYVMPSSVVEAVEVLISYGIDCDYSFEEDFHKHSGAEVFVYDQSTESYLQQSEFRRQFEQFFDGTKAHFKPKFIGTGTENVSIAETLAAHSDKKICLKFDIEGAEYDVWHELENLPPNVIGIVCELHEVDVRRSKILDWIENSAFDLVHIHVNNVTIFSNEVQCVEFTLVQPDYYKASGDIVVYPLDGLDFRNVLGRPDYSKIEFS